LGKRTRKLSSIFFCKTSFLPIFDKVKSWKLITANSQNVTSIRDRRTLGPPGRSLFSDSRSSLSLVYTEWDRNTRVSLRRETSVALDLSTSSRSRRRIPSKLFSRTLRSTNWQLVTTALPSCKFVIFPVRKVFRVNWCPRNTVHRPLLSLIFYFGNTLVEVNWRTFLNAVDAPDSSQYRFGNIQTDKQTSKITHTCFEQKYVCFKWEKDTFNRALCLFFMTSIVLTF